MNYIIIENEKISGIYQSKIVPDNAVVVSDSFYALPNENVNHFNKDWTRKPLSQLVNEKIETVPIGYKIENEQLVEMSQIEKINKGIEKLPVGKKIENDNIVDLTIEEKLKKGLITKNHEDWKKWRINELQNYLVSTDWYAIRYADEGKAIPSDIKQKRHQAREEISRLKDED